MTDDELHVQILSSDGGLENELKIRNGEDLQVAIEVLQLAARYTFDQDFAVSTGPDQDAFKEELQKLREVVEDLETVDEERFRKLEERLYDSQKLLDEQFSPSQELKEKLEKFGEMLRGQEHVHPLRRAVDESEGGAEAESGDFGDDSGEDAADTDEVQEPDEDEDEESGLKIMKAESIVEKGLVDIARPYGYEEFKGLSDAKQKAIIYDTVVKTQPATKVEVADEIFESDVTDSNGKRAQYVGYRLENKVSNLSRRRRPMDQGKDPWEYAESGFDFQVRSEQDVDEDEEKSSVESNAEAMAEDAPEPDAVEEEDPDPEEQQAEDEGAGEESDPVSDVEDIEWKSIQVAVGEYKDDHGLKYLINREHGKRYTSPMMAQSFASTNDAEDWAAVEELPEGY